MYDTILTQKNRRRICCVFLTAVLRRFFVIFLQEAYITDIQHDTQTANFPAFLPVVENRANCLQNSLFCLVIKSILRPDFDYFAASLWLSCIARQSRWHYYGLPPPPQSVFSGSKNMTYGDLGQCKKVSAVVCVWYSFCKSARLSFCLSDAGNARRARKNPISPQTQDMG